jgi:hypothetical protein
MGLELNKGHRGDDDEGENLCRWLIRAG